jgi:hypothetical protein
MNIQKEMFKSPNGLTVKELKEIVNQLPDCNADGESFEVWLESGENLSSPVKSTCALNNRTDGCDIKLY